MLESGDHRFLIVCSLPKGEGIEILCRLREKEIIHADTHSAGAFVSSRSGGISDRVEKDILTVMVSSEASDHIVEWIYREGQVGEQPWGFLYRAKVSQCTRFVLPDIPLESL